MKKKIITLLILLILSMSFLFSSTTDFALMFGAGNFFNPGEGIAVSYGATLGVSRNFEIAFTGMSELIPSFGSRNVFLLEVGATLMGARNTGSKVAGVCVNSIVALGGFYRTDNYGAGVYLGISPLTIGSPTTVRRERAFRTNIGYDFVNRNVFVTFSPLDIEIYLMGTYHDYI